MVSSRFRACAAALLSALLMTLAGPATADVYVGAYSSEWNSELDLRNLGVVGGRNVTFGGTFHRPGEGRVNTLHILDSVWKAKATPVANLEIFSSSARIARGERDADIRAWAASVQEWLALGEGRSLLIAPMAEMNGSWVPWGMDPTTFPDAFRRVVDIFRNMGMDETQVRWIWAPNSISSWPVAMTSFWPGSDYVDAVGFSAYNLGGEPSSWKSVHDSLFEASQVLRTVARDKPFLITQIGSGPEGGEQDAWITDMVQFIIDDPNMVGFVYFNFDKEADWRVWDGFEVSQGWANAMQLPGVSYAWPLTEWFQPGPMPFDPAPAIVAPVVPAPSGGGGGGGVVAPITPSSDPAFSGAEVVASLDRRFALSRARPE